MSNGALLSGLEGDGDQVRRKDLIELRDVIMRFRTQGVLRDINLTIHRGETVCIIGESGCGKTVMLKLIIGLLHPTTGSVWFDGMDISRLGGRELVKLRLRFGFLFQMAALFDSLTIYDNVAFGLREHHLCDEERVRTIVAERLQEVGLPAGLEWKKPAELSGGQRKRVGLARALALDPEVMLYDEPTTGLDPIMSDVINELILQTQSSKKTTGVVVTHDMKTVTKVADRVVMLYPLSRLAPDEPQIIYDGPPDGLDTCPDPRVRQFVRGEAGERLRELAQNRNNP
jgi:phospholipid/cholesterol/gamma-HCH transport system ATP-binding protein